MENYAEVTFLDIEENKTYRELVQEVIKKAFMVEQIDPSFFYLNIILTNPEQIRKVNCQFRHIDKETDVLSFPMFEKEEIEDILHKKNVGQEVLGDILISIPKVIEQAEEYGHSTKRELAYMLIHGFYHIMGYDHLTEEEKKQMREKEEKVLEQLHIVRES